VLLESGAGTITKGPMGELQVCSISLIDAAFYDRVMVAQFLLDNHAEPNFRGLEGRTPLSHAAGNGQIAIVELLIRHGAQIDLANRYLGTPLSYAAEKGHVAIVRILLDNGAMVDGVDGPAQLPRDATRVCHQRRPRVSGAGFNRGRSKHPRRKQ
jgi:hypothetical protein